VKHFHRPLALALVLLLGTAATAAAAATAATPMMIPLIPGLTLVQAVSERQGDYESILNVDDLDADGVLHLTASADLPDPAGGKPDPVSFNREVSSSDRDQARTYKYMFSSGAEEYPGTTAMGTSAAVVNDLRAGRAAAVTLDGELGGLAAMLGGFLQMVPGASSSQTKTKTPYLTAAGSIRVVEPKPVPYPMIVNDALVSLSAWHVKGDFVQAGAAVPVEWYILDDPHNPITLRATFGTDKTDIVRISFPVDNPTQALETALAKDRRAVTYGIYFDFNSATIKPKSAAVLQSIADVMKKNPQWSLTVEGHTDNIGGAAANQDLSARRAAAVRAALIPLGVAETRLVTSGFGSSVPRDTNATLAGRARNRRVELTRQ
jgi:outer membrane protein OmpA-like peptidoglycan-associated protein